MSYDIEWKEVGSATINQATGIIPTQYTITGLLSNKAYEYRVREARTATASAWSAWVSLRTIRQAGYTDSYTDAGGTLLANHESISGHKYGSDATWKIKDNAVYNDGGSSERLSQLYETDGVTAYITPLTFYLEWRYKELNSSSNIGFLVCAQDENNCYMIRVIEPNAVQLYRRVAGAFTQLFTTNLGGNINPLVRLTVDPSTLTVFIDGAQVFSITDTAFSRNNKAYLRCFSGGSATTGYHVQSAKIVDTTALATPLNLGAINLETDSARLTWDQG